jgi:hypothetical protein
MINVRCREEGTSERETVSDPVFGLPLLHGRAAFSRLLLREEATRSGKKLSRVPGLPQSLRQQMRSPVASGRHEMIPLKSARIRTGG